MLQVKSLSPPNDNAARRRAARAEGRRHRHTVDVPMTHRKGALATSNHLAHHPSKRSGPAVPISSASSPTAVPSISSPSTKHSQRSVGSSGGLSTNNGLHHKNHGGSPSKGRKRRLQSSSSNSSAENAKKFALTTSPFQPPPPVDEIRTHAVSIQPVLPVRVAHDRIPSLSQRYPQIFRENYVGAEQPPSAAADPWTRIQEAHKERWVPLQTSAPQQQGNQQNTMETVTQPQNPPEQSQQSSSSTSNPPPSRTSLLALPAAEWTCFAVRKDDPKYFCVGDAAGNLLLYTSEAPAMCIQTVVTSAAQREAERPVSSTTHKNAMSYPNSVGAVCWHQNIAVVWTRHEVEILDVVQHTTLFSLPLDVTTAAVPIHQPAKRQTCLFQSLDLHPSKSLLLWRPLGTCVLDEAAKEEENVSLYCVDFSNREEGAKRKVIVADKNSNMPDFFCHAAVWDKREANAILAVVSYSKGEGTCEAALCRMTMDGNILQQTRLPESSNVTGKGAGIYADCVLEQHDDYLFMCTGRGIRCYEINRLTFLTVYGETVALHNKTVGWQACYWIPEPMFDPNEIVVIPGKKKQTCWIQRPDEMSRRVAAVEQEMPQRQKLLRHESSGSASLNGSHRSSTSALPLGSPLNGGCAKSSNRLFSNMLLVGVPHPTRGPSELQSTLYVWKPGQVLPLTTLQTPPGGLLGLHVHATPTTGWRLTCATAKHGQGWQLSATFKSDFAGTMYPVGYQIVNDNIEYLEDEGELDQVLVAKQPNGDDQQSSSQRNTEESELELALQKSLETAKPTEEIISVLLDDDDDDDQAVLVPSVPDPELREVFDEGDSSTMRSPGRRVRSAPQALTLFPQYKESVQIAHEQLEEMAHRRSQPEPPTSDPIENSIQAFKLKGKRSRNATVEHVLQASIDPSLKYKMSMLNKQWTKGRSCLQISDPSVESKAKEAADFDSVVMNPPSLNQENGTKLAPPLSESLEYNAVTPSEPSPASTVSLVANGALEKRFCAACHDRMVFHVCGKRELPVDTEALEKAERERKAAEEEEKKRIRAEKRKINGAKRREKKRLEKEQKERQAYLERVEEERRLLVEQQRKEMEPYKAEHERVVRVAQESFELQPQAAVSKNTIPKFSELTVSESNSYGKGDGVSHDVTSSQHGFHSSDTATATTEAYSAPPAAPTDSYVDPNWAAEAKRSYYHSESMSTEQSGSGEADTAAATDSDALAALVGLAGLVAPTTGAPAAESHYDYAGSSDRRSAILAQARSSYYQYEESAQAYETSQPPYSAYQNGDHTNTTDHEGYAKTEKSNNYGNAER